MEVGFGKVLLGLTLLLGALAMDVNGTRTLKEFDQPQTFGSFGGTSPSSGSVGSFPGPSGFAFGSPSFCSFPGVQCTPVQPTIPFVPNGGGSPIGETP
ncbi:hypothetical protein SASPL_131639 [Salvia splendens]|uniref:Uncharacterized protein n=1 Tax=Salvia splendens TaxID=180675 RepID=A0A8X8X7T7_SALSN|nr:hypothetical protein SASPL_131639 [Salvia splendens]